MKMVCSTDRTACRDNYGDFVEQVTEYRQELDKLSGMDLPRSLKTDVAIIFCIIVMRLARFLELKLVLIFKHVGV